MKEMLDYEKERWKEKGPYWVFGIALFMFYPLVLPELIKPLYEFLLSHFDECITFVLLIQIVHHVSYALHCAILIVIALLKNPSLEKFRVNPSSWPWEVDMPLIKRNAVTLFVNFFLINPIVAYVGYKTDLFSTRFETVYPSFTEVLWQILFCMVTEDIWSYTFHALNHYGPLYRNIHKKHHQYNITIGISAEYAHPIEFIMVNIAALSTGVIILRKRMHYISFLSYMSYRIGDTVDQHGGYEFPISPFSILPFATTAHFHDYHHSANIGNYGSQFAILDAMFNTSPGFYNHMKKRNKKYVKRAPQGSHTE
ncbi:unnamed protein product [Blepharisma stoltei]|uniref:Fatty acid hydroxylase domain-containing protein n=1 Tax=Blepharisma stoltei TaxID=1481888 RepID=A0AAU9JU98_9CILI|nr:unnamed protein product [Blepharisma stoltei]